MACTNEHRNILTANTNLLNLRVFDCHGSGINVQVSPETLVGELRKLIQTCFSKPQFKAAGNICPGSQRPFTPGATFSAVSSAQCKANGSGYLHQFNLPTSSSHLNGSTNLICVRQHRRLQANRSLKEESVINDDALLFLPKLAFANWELRFDEASKALSFESVALATKDLPPKNLDHCIVKVINPHSRVKKEIYPVLVTLIDFAESLLQDQPDVRIILKEMTDELIPVSEQTDADAESESVDETKVQRLIEMGFSREKVLQALHQCQMNQLEAMDWLLAYETCSSTSTTTQPEMSDVEQTCQEKVSTDFYPRVPIIVNCHRRYQRATFQPNQRSLLKMKQMGVDENRVRDALWIHNNNENAACEWLRNERQLSDASLTVGIGRESELYRSLLLDPVVALSLTKPSILFGMLHEIENPIGKTRWARDMQFLRLYEKIWLLFSSHTRSSRN